MKRPIIFAAGLLKLPRLLQKVKVLVIPTNEELLIAKDTYSLLDDNVVSIARAS